MSAIGRDSGARKVGPSRQRLGTAARSPVLWIGVLGALVRLVFLWSSRGDPSFDHPLVDAKTYHDLARAFPATGWNEKFLWQAVFYPAWLTFVYKLFGVSVLAATVLQTLLGGLTCALTCRLGTAVGNRQIGLGAGLIMVFCGPVIFFETQLLATGWAIFWMAALTWWLVRCLSRPTAKALLALGLGLALAVYTRPTFLPLGLVMLIFVVQADPMPGAKPARRRLLNAGVIVAGFLAVAGPASVFFHTTTGHLGLVPPSGGINLFIGNNSDYQHTINIRPGLDWANLVAEPARHGYEANPWAGNPYFRGQALQFARTRPGAFLAGLGQKTLTLFSSREMPRNLDIYLHRQWSNLLAVSTWKLGAWGFPFGLIFPFALVGLVRTGGRRLLVVKVLLAVAAAALVLVFVSARYRVTLMPLLAVLAASGFAVTLATVRGRQWREVLAVGALLLGGVLVSTVPGPFAQESVDLEAELYFNVARDLYDQEQWAAAAENLERSLALDPNVHAAQQIMGIAQARLGHTDRAVQHFEEALRLNPGHASTQTNVAQARQERARELFLAGRSLEAADPGGALTRYRAAAQDLPDWYKPVAREAWLLSTATIDSLRDGGRAIRLAQQAIALRGSPDAYLQFVLSAALAESGQFGAAAAEAEKALSILASGEEPDMAAEIVRSLALFRAARPLRQQVERSNR